MTENNTPTSRDWRNVRRTYTDEDLASLGRAGLVALLRSEQAVRKSHDKTMEAIARDVMTNEYLDSAGACMDGRQGFLNEHGISVPTHVKLFIGTGSTDDWDYCHPDEIDTNELDSSWDGRANADFYDVWQGWEDEVPQGFTSALEALSTVKALIRHADEIHEHGGLEEVMRKARAFDAIVTPKCLASALSAQASKG